MRLLRRTAALGLVLLLGTACAAPAPVAPGQSGEPSRPTERPGPTGVGPQVLAAWRDFPVRRTPRPIVLLGAMVKEPGYRTDEAKVAVATGRVELATTPPTAPAAIRVALPDGTHRLPTASAAEAFAVLRAHGKPENAPGQSPPPVRITRVSLGEAEFPTDRGRLRLPAWLFHAAEFLEPIAVPALAASAFWRPGELAATGLGDSRLSADGRTLTVVMAAPHPSPCPGQPSERFVPTLVESATAVAVGVRVEFGPTASGDPGTTCARDLMLRTAEYQVTLGAPLGNRVLVNAEGAPQAVTPPVSG
ncbi:MAG TPA: hypothetical protein VNV66_14265 [Pilimelia sp.]|nr:hypothetical protein [Pilimelia sp.]